MPTGITDLPNEVIQLVVRHLRPASIPTFQLVNRRFSGLIDDFVWRSFCNKGFKYWNPSHHIERKFHGNVEDTDWKALYIHRHTIDHLTTKLLDSILSSQVGRIEKFQQIIKHGYDTKDCLLRHYNVSEDTEDALARRYYSSALLGCVHRIMAIEEWAKLQRRESVPLERALTAFDMFVLHDRAGDFDDVSSRLDILADSIRLASPELGQKTTRQKALLIAEYLRANDLVGCSENRKYHDLENAFLGIALHSNEHSSLPLISAAIFCCVSQRLGVNALICNFPFHCVITVHPTSGLSLDGDLATQGAKPMYLDPFNSAEEVEYVDLISRLEQINAPRFSFRENLSASPTEEIVLRNGRNIINSVQESARHTTVQQVVPMNGEWPTSAPFPDLESSFYGALWASLLLGIPPDGDGPALAHRRRNFLPHIIEHFETHFPTDVSLIEQYILPIFQHTAEHAQLRESVRVTRSVDSMPKEKKRRTADTPQRVRYKIGQVFTHKRYHYQAVITGWDIECGADEHWMLQMRVHELSRGKQQSFYHVLVEDKSVRYVAEENIKPISPEIPLSLLNLAGRHFKRWDKVSRCFVSNIKDEYPDD